MDLRYNIHCMLSLKQCDVLYFSPGRISRLILVMRLGGNFSFQTLTSICFFHNRALSLVLWWRSVSPSFSPSLFFPLPPSLPLFLPPSLPPFLSLFLSLPPSLSLSLFPSLFLKIGWWDVFHWFTLYRRRRRTIKKTLNYPHHGYYLFTSPEKVMQCNNSSFIISLSCYTYTLMQKNLMLLLHAYCNCILHGQLFRMCMHMYMYMYVYTYPLLDHLL